MTKQNGYIIINTIEEIKPFGFILYVFIETVCSKPTTACTCVIINTIIVQSLSALFHVFIETV